MVALITALSAVLIAIVSGGSVHLRRQKKRDEHLNDKLDVVKNQVANDHGTNLRHDLDIVTGLVGSVKLMMESLGPQVQNLQTTMNNMDRRLIDTDGRAIAVAGQLAEHMLTAQRRDDRITILEDKLITKEVI
jgi:tetrahydromethanopterin S-methyltransferase subunit G